jgi:hypothetical protein
VTLPDGRAGSVVLVGARDNAKGAILVFPGVNNEGVEKLALSSGVELLHPQHVTEILCMQERAFGNSGLTPPQQ